MRFERKYRIEGLTLEEVYARVREHPLSFYKQYPDRQVNNIYLDSPDLEQFRMNLIGAPERRKYRVRWYGHDDMTIQSPVLEVKIKHNELGEKETLKLTDPPALDSDAVQAWIDSQVPERGPLVPVLLNRYERSYLVSYDGKFRLTLDRVMRFHSMEFPAFQPFHYLEDDAIVMEIKYERELDPDWKRISWHFPFRVGKNSKYVNGVLMTGLI